ncbi:MAG: hypothetical protein SGILL_001906 [Bacillariaceae sp.]
MSSSINEIRPLKATGDDYTTSANDYGVYNDDDYRPIDENSRNILKRRKMTKYAGVVVAAAILVLATVLAVVSISSKHGEVKHYTAIQSDHLFAGLLADSQAFYFPTTTSSVTNGGSDRRFLRSLKGGSGSTGVDWSYDWTTNSKDGAAVGEYYRAKGLAMADYYRSKFDPTYKAGAANENADADASVDVDAEDDADDSSTWTYDWKADMDRGVALGQHYKAIGDAINAHYKEAFDPTYTSAADANDGANRMLKSEEKKSKDRKKKELAMDMGDNGSTWYDWQEDRDRGMAIGAHYKEMGQQIADHYNQEFNPMYDVNKKAYADKNWATMWQDYQKHGQEIADYYKGKGAAIDKFYQGKFTPEQELNSNDSANTVADSANAAIAGGNPDAAHIWGIDWEKDRQQAMGIHDDMMKKGLAISDYYRSKYDPTYGAATSTAANEAEEVADASPVDATPEAHNPDLDFPPWGVDAEADRQHGIAIGEYWKNKGKAMGATYEKQGKDIGAYYENKYRTMFDPTYVADP